MKKAALLLCTLLLAALAGCQLGGKAIILPKAGNITAIQVETLEGESLSLTQEEDIAVQDQPLVEPYGTIRLENRGGATVLYYYKEGDATLVEQPYTGIFRLEGSLESALPPQD